MLNSFEVEGLLRGLGFELVEVKTHALGFEHKSLPDQRIYLKDGRNELDAPRKFVRRHPLVLNSSIKTLPGFADTDAARRSPAEYKNTNLSMLPRKDGVISAGLAVAIADEAALLEILDVLGLKEGVRFSPVTSSAPKLSETAAWWVHCFLSPENPQLHYWWPRYRESVGRLAAAMAADDLDLAFRIIWLDQDNHVSNAGQGILGQENAERSRVLLTQLIRDAYADGSPAQFQRTIDQLRAERELGLQKKTPHLLAARMFAALHPQSYHTTVDSNRQISVLDWFAEHTGLRPPTGDWAEVARALTRHLQGLDCFNGDILLRNMFPWFVHMRLMEQDDPQQLPRKAQKHVARASETYADVPAERRRIILRHNVLSTFLANQLEETNPGRVRVEGVVGSGGTFDVLVLSAERRKQGGDLYEIKVADTAGSAVRQALGQLLEYAHRQPGLRPGRMYVAAEPELDSDTAAYLSHLREQYGIPLHYHRIVMPENTSGPSAEVSM